jgi:hypothetical protein
MTIVEIVRGLWRVLLAAPNYEAAIKANSAIERGRTRVSANYWQFGMKPEAAFPPHENWINLEIVLMRNYGMYRIEQSLPFL